VEQKWPRELMIIRHGQSTRNVKKDAAKAIGSTADYSEGLRDEDTPLTAVGISQAEQTGIVLGGGSFYPGGTDMAIDTVIVSPYVRTRQTANRLVHGLGYQPKMVIEERVREIEFGIFDGLTPDGMAAKFPEEVARRKRQGKYWYRPPGGESRPDVRLRVHSFLDTLRRDYSGQRVVIICHSGVVLAFRSLLERWGEDEYMAVDKENDVKNCGITRYAYTLETIPGFMENQMKFRLQEYNTVLYKTAAVGQA
jgi:broad specificity phosphatase PhoE